MTKTTEEARPRGSWILVGLVVGWIGFKSVINTTLRFFHNGAKQVHAEPPLEDKHGRAADRREKLDSPSSLRIRRTWGTLLVVCAFILSLLAGVAFLFAYWTGQGNLLLGGTLALSLGGLGIALVWYSHLLMIHKQAHKAREILPSSPGEREELLESFRQGKHDIHRRALLTWMVSLIGLVFAAAVVSLMRSLGETAFPALYDTVWNRGQRLMTLEGNPVSLDSLQPGSSVVVFPEDSIGSERAQTMLVRVEERLLQLPRDRADWAPGGYLAYSRVCTHAGCPVALYETTTCLLLCPCHQSTFDVLKSAHPNGGPAVRPLPQLPLYSDENGTIRAGGGFTAPPGPGFWETP